MNYNIFVTNNCNLRCTYCYVDKLSSNRDQMDAETVLKSVDFIKGQSQNPIIRFHGGEPLLALPAIKTFIESFKYSPASFHITTNGLLLGEENVMEYLLENFEGISVSIDGDFETTQRTRNISKTDYHSIITNALFFCENHHNFMLRITFNKTTLSHLKQSIDYLLGLGFTNFGIEPDLTSHFAFLYEVD